MKWLVQKNQPKTWTLLEPGRNAELKYNNDGHSFRLSAADKRLFFLERKGLFQNRMLLKTEYNIVVGEIHFTPNIQSGQLILDNEKFGFSVKGEELYLFSGNHEHFRAAITGLRQLDAFEFSALLFGLVRVSHQHEPIMA